MPCERLNPGPRKPVAARPSPTRSRPRPGAAPGRVPPRYRGAARARGGSCGCRSRGPRLRWRAGPRRFFWQRRVLSDDEETDRQPARGEELEDARHDYVEVGRMRLPRRVAMRLHVRPLVVEVERKARERISRLHRLAVQLQRALRGVEHFDDTQPVLAVAARLLARADAFEEVPALDLQRLAHLDVRHGDVAESQRRRIRRRCCSRC